MKNKIIYLFIFILPIISSFIALFGTFSQTLPFMKNSSTFYKILTSEFWATINVAINVPFLRIANQYLNPAQLILYGYFVSFFVQIFSNKYLFISETSFDDYVAIFVMLIAMTISVYKIFD